MRIRYWRISFLEFLKAGENMVFYAKMRNLPDDDTQLRSALRFWARSKPQYVGGNV